MPVRAALREQPSPSTDRLPADDPVGGFRVDEAGRLQIVEPIVIDVVLQVAGGGAGIRAGADRATELLGKRAFDVEVTESLAAVIVVDDDRVFDRENGGIYFHVGQGAGSVLAAVALPDPGL